MRGSMQCAGKVLLPRRRAHVNWSRKRQSRRGLRRQARTVKNLPPNRVERGMAVTMKMEFVVQPFEVHRKQLLPARWEPAQIQRGAGQEGRELGGADARRGRVEGIG